jgi:hypothetical protein
MNYQNKNNSFTKIDIIPQKIKLPSWKVQLGMRSNGQRVYSEKHILVADRNGIHKLDSKGNYLDSPIEAGQHGLERGDFYGIAIDGYGIGSRLYLADRKNNKIKVFKAVK